MATSEVQSQYGITVSLHYNDVIMGAIASLITSLTIVYSAVYSDADQRKHQSTASQAFVRGIHRGPVNSPHKWPVTRKMFSFDDVIMVNMEIRHAKNKQLLQQFQMHQQNLFFLSFCEKTDACTKVNIHKMYVRIQKGWIYEWYLVPKGPFCEKSSSVQLAAWHRRWQVAEWINDDPVNW